MEKEKGFAAQLLHAGVRPGSHMGTVSMQSIRFLLFIEILMKHNDLLADLTLAMEE